MQTESRSVRATPRRRASAAPRRTALAIALACLLIGSVRADDSVLDSAAALVAQHRAAAAFDMLAPLESSRAGEPRFDYLLGVAALDTGRITQAILALERVLAMRPDDQPARAELGRAYLAAGELDNARRELAQARKADLPPAAAAAIDRVLGALDQVAPAPGVRMQGYVEAFAGHDSNVNSATNAGQFSIPAFGGLLFATTPESRRRQDTFAGVAGGVALQYALAPEWAAIATLNGRQLSNRHAHDMNLGTLDGSLGLTHVAGAHTQSIVLQSVGTWLSSSVYRTSNGVAGQWQVRLDEASQVSAFTQWSRQRYDAQSARDTDRTVIGAAYAGRLARTGTIVYGSLYAADEPARTAGFDHFGHRAAGLRFGAEQALGGRAVLFAEAQHERRRYGGTEPLFDRRREDRQSELLAGIRHSPAPTWQLTGQLRRTYADSNVVLYDYGRTVLQLSLRKEFP